MFAKRNLFVYNIHDFIGIDSGLTAKSFKGVHYGQNCIASQIGRAKME